MNKTVKFCLIEEIGNTNKLVGKHTNKQVDKQTNKQVNRQTNKQVDKQTTRKQIRKKHISSQSKYISDTYLSLL